MESIVGLYKTDCIKPDVFHTGHYRSITDVEYATMAWVEWYNTRRLHSAQGLNITFMAVYGLAGAGIMR